MGDTARQRHVIFGITFPSPASCAPGTVAARIHDPDSLSTCRERMFLTSPGLPGSRTKICKWPCYLSKQMEYASVCAYVSGFIWNKTMLFRTIPTMECHPTFSLGFYLTFYLKNYLASSSKLTYIVTSGLAFYWGPIWHSIWHSIWHPVWQSTWILS